MKKLVYSKTLKKTKQNVLLKQVFCICNKSYMQHSTLKRSLMCIYVCVHSVRITPTITFCV